MAREAPPVVAIEIIAGLPGSGKSFVAVLRIIKDLMTRKRPVYTNLPLKFRVFRKYLERTADARTAGLIYELKEAHFRAYIRRFAERAAFFEELKSLKGKRIKRKERQRLWEERAGPDICEGADANWIPANSLIVIDEVQHWFPMARQGSDPPELLAYLTMHRHALQDVWVITQEPGRISVNFRKLARVWWKVRNMAEDRLAWGIRWKHIFGLFGITAPAFGYAMFTAEQLQGDTLENARPVENFVVMPWLPKYRPIFKVYSSYTHGGDARELREVLEGQRMAAGLYSVAEGVSGDQGDGSGEEVGRMGVGRAAARVGWLGVRGLGHLLVLVACLVLGFGLGRASAPVPVPGPEEQLAPASAVAAAPGMVQVGPSWGQWQGGGVVEREDQVVPFVRVSGRQYRPGDRSPAGATLFDVAPDGKLALWELDGELWLWRFGDQEPRRLGAVPLVLAALRGAVAGAAGGGGVGATAGDPAEAVGASAGDGDGG